MITVLSMRNNYMITHKFLVSIEQVFDSVMERNYDYAFDAIMERANHDFDYSEDHVGYENGYRNGDYNARKSSDWFDLLLMFVYVLQFWYFESGIKVIWNGFVVLNMIRDILLCELKS